MPIAFFVNRTQKRFAFHETIASVYHVEVTLSTYKHKQHLHTNACWDPSGCVEDQFINVRARFYLEKKLGYGIG